jgi:hypothetical protein
MEKFLILVDIFLDIAYNGRPQEHPGMIQFFRLKHEEVPKTYEDIVGCSM